MSGVCSRANRVFLCVYKIQLVYKWGNSQYSPVSRWLGPRMAMGRVAGLVLDEWECGVLDEWESGEYTSTPGLHRGPSLTTGPRESHTRSDNPACLHVRVSRSMASHKGQRRTELRGKKRRERSGHAEVARENVVIAGERSAVPTQPVLCYLQLRVSLTLTNIGSAICYLGIVLLLCVVSLLAWRPK